MDQLQQIAFDREMDRKQREAQAAEHRAELAEALHAAELRRIEERKRKQKAAVDATSRFLSASLSFLSASSTSFRLFSARSSSDDSRRSLLPPTTEASSLFPSEESVGISSARSRSPDAEELMRIGEGGGQRGVGEGD